MNTRVVVRRRKGPDWLRIGAHAAGLTPLAVLGVQAAGDALTVNPIQFIEQSMGRAAVYLLLLSLAVTPLKTLFGWRALSPQRRTLGLYAFGYFALHLFTFAVIDYGLDLREILRQIPEKPFILIGLAAGVILLALAVTSFRWWMQRMGKKWSRLHRLVYVAAVLALLHFAMARKGSLATLSGDLILPLSLAGLLGLFLVARIPAVRTRLSALRGGSKKRPA